MSSQLEGAGSMLTVMWWWVLTPMIVCQHWRWVSAVVGVEKADLQCQSSASVPYPLSACPYSQALFNAFEDIKLLLVLCLVLHEREKIEKAARGGCERVGEERPGLRPGMRGDL